MVSLRLGFVCWHAAKWTRPSRPWYPRRRASRRLLGALLSLIEKPLPMQKALLLDHDVVLAGLGKLVAVAHVPLRHEVVLDPDDLAQGLDDGDLALQVQARVAEDGLGHDVLDQRQADAQVDVLDVERVGAAEADVHHAGACQLSSMWLNSCVYIYICVYAPNLVQVLPKLHGAGVRAQLAQVRAQEHLAVQDLRAVLAGRLVERAVEAGGAGGEGARGDVVLQQLAVDDVDDGGDQRLDVLGAGDEGFDVVCDGSVWGSYGEKGMG